MISAKGLALEANLLQEILEELGHKVVTIDYTEPSHATQSHINIFLEVMPEPFFNFATQNWLIPNPEGCGDDPMKQINKFDKILCKTLSAKQAFEEYFTGKSKHPEVVYLGFFSPKPDAELPALDKISFLHIAGDNCYRGTDAVLRAWEEYELPHSLTVVSHIKDHFKNFRNPNIKLLEKVPLETLNKLRSENLFHIQPSQTEGWGHALWESIAMGAILLTTDAPPMNEYTNEIGYRCEFTLGNSCGEKKHLASLYNVSCEEIADMVRFIGSLNLFTEVERLRNAGMQKAENLRVDFTERLKEIINGNYVQGEMRV